MLFEIKSVTVQGVLLNLLMVKVLNILKAIRNGFDEVFVPEEVKRANKMITFLTKVKPKNLTASQALDLKQKSAFQLFWQ